MDDVQIDTTRSELLRAYPGCRMKVSEDKREMVAEIRDGFAVAVIEKSQPHFHGTVRETYRVLRGELCVACGGRGYVLRVGETLTIDPGLIHHARAVGEPVWIEVESEPPWSLEDQHLT